MLSRYDLDHKGSNMNDDSELIQRKAEDIPECDPNHIYSHAAC